MSVGAKGRLTMGLVLLVLLLSSGTLGYMLIEGWNFFDSIYMTITTVATVGFGEVHPLTAQGRVFTMVLIGVGVGAFLYLITVVTEEVVEGKLRQVMGRRTVERKIRALKDHYIICGYGRIGAMVAEMLHERSVRLVVIDNHEEATRRLGEQGMHYVLGSATEEETLLAAGIERAKGLVATVSSDADNVYIVLTAKGMNPDLFVIARATEPGSERKLKRAGADKVVSPYFIGARRMAQTIIRPSVADFIDLTYHSSDIGLQMEELVVGDHTEIAGQSLRESNIRQKLDVIILGVKKANVGMIFNPPADTVIESGDTLIALGPYASMVKLGSILSET